MPVKYTLKACAKINDKVTAARSDCLNIEIFLELSLVSEPKTKVTYTFGKSEIKTPFPKYSCQLGACPLDLNYDVLLISKKTDIRFDKNPQLN